MRFFDRFKKQSPKPSRRAFAPRKGTLTQCIVLLFEAPPTLDELENALKDYPMAKRSPGASGPDGWTRSGDSLIVPFRPEVNGYAQVDIVERPWPDGRLGNGELWAEYLPGKPSACA
jgi:hypothetical protein